MKDENRKAMYASMSKPLQVEKLLKNVFETNNPVNDDTEIPINDDTELYHEKYISKEEIQKVKQVKMDIDDYVQRYGDKSWAGNHIKIEIDPNINVNHLDTKSRFWLENFREQAKKGTWEFDEAEEMANQIHSRLSHLKRDLRTVFYQIQDKWHKERHDIWDKEERMRKGECCQPGSKVENNPR